MALPPGGRVAAEKAIAEIADSYSVKQLKGNDSNLPTDYDSPTTAQEDADWKSLSTELVKGIASKGRAGKKEVPTFEEAVDIVENLRPERTGQKSKEMDLFNHMACTVV